MKHGYFLLLAIALSGCVIPTGPEPVRFNNSALRSYYDLDLANLINFPNASGIFSSREESSEFLDTAGKRMVRSWDESHGTLINEIGDIIEVKPAGISLNLNGTNMLFTRYDEFDTILDPIFPSPVTWSMKGDSYFPSFTHTINSENMPEIMSPLVTDTLSAGNPFDLSFNSPGTDSLTVTLFYFVSAILKTDTTATVQTDIPDIQRTHVANTGHYLVSSYVPRDTINWRSITPTEVLASLAWAKSDTINIGGKMFGFVTEVVRTRDYFFKP